MAQTYRNRIIWGFTLVELMVGITISIIVITMAVNYDAPYTLGDGVGSTKSVLTANVTNKPVIIKKNATQFYIVYFNNNTVYKYLYSYGVSSPSLVLTNIFLDRQFKKL